MGRGVLIAVLLACGDGLSDLLIGAPEHGEGGAVYLLRVGGY